jgi:hypothetical protein
MREQSHWLRLSLASSWDGHQDNGSGYAFFHLIEPPIDALWSAGATGRRNRKQRRS